MPTIPNFISYAITIILFCHFICGTSAQLSFYVNGSSPISGTGEENSPFTSIEDGINKVRASAVAGQTIDLILSSAIYQPENSLQLHNIPGYVNLIGSASSHPVIQCPYKNGNPSGIALSIQNTNVDVRNLKIVGCSRYNAIYVSTSGEFNVSFSNVESSNNKISTNVVKVVVENSKSLVTFIGCIFNNNVINTPLPNTDAQENSGVMLINGLNPSRESPDVNINRCIFQNNTLETYAGMGGVLSSSNAIIFFNNSQASDNTVTSVAGGNSFAYSIGGFLKISNSIISRGKASVGGCLNAYLSNLTVEHTVISDHFASNHGTFIFGTNSNATFDNVTATKLWAGGHSFFECQSCASITFSRSKISDLLNTQPNGGSPVYFVVRGSYQKFSVLESTVENSIALVDMSFFQLDSTSPTDKMEVVMQNSTFRNITSSAGLFNVITKLELTANLKNTTFDRIISKNTFPILFSITDLTYTANVYMDNCTITGNYGRAIILLTTKGIIEIRKTKIINNILYIAGIGIEVPATDFANLTLEETEISNHEYIVPLRLSGFNINSSIKKCTFANNTKGTNGGAISLTLSNSTVVITESVFDSNEAVLGGAIYGSWAWVKTTALGEYNNLQFDDNIYVNNKAVYGGVLYSQMSKFKDDARLNGNKYGNNTATMGGGVFYFPRQYHCPDSIRASDAESSQVIPGLPNIAPYGSFLASDPFELRVHISSDSSNLSLLDNRISLYSGATLPDIIVQMTDDFGQTVVTPSDGVSQNSMILIKGKISSGSEKYAAIAGGLCVVYEGNCTLRGLIAGIPGNYQIDINPIATEISVLKSRHIMQNVTITDCPTGLVNSTMEGIPFSVCQPPKCSQSCGSHGTCVKNDVCSCATGYVGPTCSDYNLYLISGTSILIIQIISIVELAIMVVLCVLIVVLGRTSPLFAKSDKLLLGGIACGCALAFISMIVLDSDVESLNCIKTPLIQRIAFLVVFTAVSINSSRTISAAMLLQPRAKDDASITSSVVERNSPKLKLIILGGLTLIYIGIVIAWIVITGLAPTSYQFLSNGTFYPRCSGQQLSFAILCAEICMLCVSAYWSLPYWDLAFVHKETRFSLASLYNWIVAGPILNIVATTVLEFPDAKVILNVISVMLTYVTFMTIFCYHVYVLVTGNAGSEEMFIVPAKEASIISSLNTGKKTDKSTSVLNTSAKAIGSTLRAAPTTPA